MTPYMFEENIDGDVHISIGVDMGEAPITADFQISIPSINCNEHFHHVYTHSEVFGMAVCSSKDILDSEIFTNDKFVIEIVGTFSTNKINMDPSNLGHALWNADNKDFTIFVEDKEIKVSAFLKM